MVGMERRNGCERDSQGSVNKICHLWDGAGEGEKGIMNNTWVSDQGKGAVAQEGLQSSCET